MASRLPDLASEWHPHRNTVTAQQVTVGSRRRVWWQCSSGHEWETSVSNRALGGWGCAQCVEWGTSKREQAICALVAAELGVVYSGGPVRVPGWRGPVDLVVPDLRVLVDFDGWYWHREKVEIDRRKTMALSTRGWVVVRIRESSRGNILPDVGGIRVDCLETESPETVAMRVVSVIRGRCPEEEVC
ncbi:zinc-ribbon domain-containing protein [Nocardia transvalensis]|uniref:zinc-ribbon domain-containing protein n=1 Tax=Nocardia transvalensis TaxID=37333 RepID=UPI001E2DDABE|nr:zinc-ribbon domain-containing protein [Nocardia transvalensis]